MKCIELFAGLGGQSTGAVMAGHQVLWAANHWALAVQYHQLNHPGTDHATQDLRQFDFSQVPDHDLLLASPCCQGHSKARGKHQPRHDDSRSTTWAVMDAAEAKRPEFLLIENVPELMNWVLFPTFADGLARLGYTLSPHVVDAADYGVAQNRVRLFLVGTKSKNPIQLDLKKRHQVSARSIIDMGSGRWSAINKAGRSPATLARIERGRQELGTETFLIPYYKSGSGLTGRSLDRPIGTITTKDRWAVVDGDRMRMLTVDETRDFMSFPASTKLPLRRDHAVHLLGNAVPPVLACEILTALERAA